uniref:tyrosine-type recombinase/integrase n=1 Tax=Burkholderia pseudomallei TaxID=28450 RepID=UPI0005724FA8
MPLTDVQVRNAKASAAPYKLTDGNGMFLLVQPNGAKYWRLSYRFLGKEKRYSLGVYPEVTLATARKKRDEAREKLAAGIDPGEAKKAEKRASLLAAAHSFEVVARGWMDERKTTVEPAQHDKTLARMENDVFPWLGKRPIAEIDAPEILVVLKRVDGRGARFTAHRIRSEISRVFRYGIKEGHCKADPARDLVDAIPPAQTTH